jgi:hypothetical protein
MNIDAVICHSDIIIVSDKYTMNIANNLSEELKNLNLSCVISDGIINTDKMHIILCPNNLKMPQNYIIFQIQQISKCGQIIGKISNDMKNSVLTCDYSLLNFIYYNNIFQNFISYQPLPISNKLMEFIPEYSYDILYFGSLNDRRKKILDGLSNENFIVATAHDLFRDNLYYHIKKAKIILNLHNHNDSILETYKLNEILQFNTLIISETTNETNIKKLYENDIFFVDVIDDNLSNIQLLKYKIQDLLNNFDHYNKLKSNIRKTTIENIYNIFSYNLKRNLVASNILNTKMININLNKNKILCIHGEKLDELERFNKLNYKFVDNINYFNMIKYKNEIQKKIMNYKILFKNLLNSDLQYITICNTSCLIPNNFNEIYKSIIEYFIINCADMYINITETVDENDVSKLDLYNDTIFLHYKKYRESNFTIFSRNYAKKFLEKYEEEFDSIDFNKFQEEHNFTIISNNVKYFDMIN